MASFISKLFSAPRSRGTDAQRSARLKRSAHRRTLESLAVQSLEPRLALAITATQTILTTTPATIAWEIQIDDTINGGGPLLPGNTTGNGTNAYLQAATDRTAIFSCSPIILRSITPAGCHFSCRCRYELHQHHRLRPFCSRVHQVTVIHGVCILRDSDPAAAGAA
jgi:hypothetical protein